MKTSRWNFGATVIGRTIYVCGGYSGDLDSGYKALDTIEEYDIDTDTWSGVSKTLESREGCAAVSVRDRYVAIVGGTYPWASKNHSSIEIYDTYSKSMIGSPAKNPALLVPRHGYTAHIVQGAMFVVGGHADGHSKSIETLSISKLLTGWSISKLLAGWSIERVSSDSR